jgi:hypothetical protein
MRPIWNSSLFVPPEKAFEFHGMRKILKVQAVFFPFQRDFDNCFISNIEGDTQQYIESLLGMESTLSSAHFDGAHDSEDFPEAVPADLEVIPIYPEVVDTKQPQHDFYSAEPYVKTPQDNDDTNCGHERHVLWLSCVIGLLVVAIIALVGGLVGGLLPKIRYVKNLGYNAT